LEKYNNIRAMYEVIVPVKEYVREYLIAQFGHKAIFLPETNSYSVLLRDRNRFACDISGYSHNIAFLSEVKIDVLENHNVVKLNHYIEMQIKLMMVFRSNMRPNNLKDVLLDIMAENNFPEQKFNTLKSYYHDMQRYATH